MRVSYLQIYNEDVCDLLGKNPATKLEVTIVYMYACMCVCIRACSACMLACVWYSVVLCEQHVVVCNHGVGQGETRCWCVCERIVHVHCEKSKRNGETNGKGQQKP